MDIEFTEAPIDNVLMSIPSPETVQTSKTGNESATVFQNGNEQKLFQEQPQTLDHRSDRISRKKLVARWVVENGELICRWLVNDTSDNPGFFPKYGFLKKITH